MWLLLVMLNEEVSLTTPFVDCKHMWHKRHFFVLYLQDDWWDGVNDCSFGDLVTETE